MNATVAFSRRRYTESSKRAVYLPLDNIIMGSTSQMRVVKGISPKDNLKEVNIASRYRKV